MNALYRFTGFSKQNFHQRLQREEAKAEELAQLEWLIYDIRDAHPRIGQRKLYRMLQPTCLGRDAFSVFYRQKGFCITQRRNYKRTTDSTGVIRFPNLIADLEVTMVNQVWVSDITYYEIKNVFYYLTFIMDRYSRFIVGYQASRRLLTSDTTIPALKQAFRYLRSEEKPILHSDGGGQYYSRTFLSLTHQRCINSMADNLYENIHAERINGTIKNEYLIPWAPQDYRSLQRLLGKAVNNYNHTRPHEAIAYQTPAELFFEQDDGYLNTNQTRKRYLQTKCKTVNSI